MDRKGYISCGQHNICIHYQGRAGRVWQSSCITMKHITGPFTDSCNALHVWISVMGKRFVTRQRLVGGAFDNVLVMSRVRVSASTLFFLSVPFTFHCICLPSNYVY